MKLAPVANTLPPVEAPYHWATPLEHTAPNVTVPVPQIEPGVTLGADCPEFTVALTSTLDDSQPALDLQLTK